MSKESITTTYIIDDSKFDSFFQDCENFIFKDLADIGKLVDQLLQKHVEIIIQEEAESASEKERLIELKEVEQLTNDSFQMGFATGALANLVTTVAAFSIANVAASFDFSCLSSAANTLSSEFWRQMVFF